MDRKELLARLKEKQELLAILGLVLLIIILIILGLRTQQNYLARKNEPEKELREPTKIEVSTQAAGSGSDGQGDGNNGATGSSSTFYLKPTPGELVAVVKELVESELPVPKEKYENLRIVWPLYFFEVVTKEARLAKVMFDTSPDGFGVNVTTYVDFLRYPEILQAKAYQKVWLAGEVTGIEAEGTGTIHMTAEHVRFQDELPELLKVMPAREESQ